MSERKVGSLFVSLVLGTGEFKKQFGDVTRDLRNQGRQLSQIGKDISLRLGAPLAAIGGIAVRQAAQFESAFAGIRKTVNATETQFADLKKEILDMSKRMPTSAAEIAKVGEVSGQLGIKADDISRFSEVMVKLGATTNVAAEEAAVSIARIQNVTKLPTDKVEAFASVLVELGNNFAANEQEILHFTARIAPAAGIVGVTASEITAFSVALAAAGLEAESSGTAIQKVLLGMFSAAKDGGKDLEKFAKAAGLSAESMRDLITNTPGEALLKLVQGLGKINEEGGNVVKVLGDLGLDNERTKAVMLALAGSSDTVTRAFGMQAEQFKKNTALNEEYQKKLQTFNSQFQIFKNVLSGVAIEIGETLLPNLIKLMDGFKGVANVTGEVVKFFKFLGEQSAVYSAIFELAKAFGMVLIVIGPVVFALGSLKLAMLGIVKLMAIAGFANVWVLAFTALLAIAMNLDKILWTLKTTWDSVAAYMTKRIDELSIKWLKLKALLLEYLSVFTGAYDKTAAAGIDEQILQTHNQIYETEKGALKWQAALKKVEEQSKNVTGEQKKQTEATEGTTGAIEKLAGGFNSLGEEGEKALSKINERLQDIKNENALQSIQKQMEKAFDTGAFDKIDELKKKLLSLKQQEVFQKYAEEIAAGGAEAEKAALEVYQQEAIKVEEDIAERMKQAQIAAHKEAVDAWRGFFQNAINGISFNLKDTLKNIAVGFAAEMISGLKLPFGDMIGGGPQDFGGNIFSVLTGDKTISELFGSAAEELPTAAGSLETAGTSLTESSGILTQAGAGFLAVIPALAALGGAALLFKGVKDLLAGGATKGAEGWAARGQLAITTGGLSEVFRGVKSMFKGLFGGGNAETEARKDAASKLNKTLAQLAETLKITDASFKLNSSLFDNFTEKNWGEKFTSAAGGKENANAFFGAGIVFQNQAGTSIDPGQMAAMLQDALGNIDNLRAALQEMNISQEDFIGAIVEAGNKGEVSWLEVASAIRDSNAAFGEGLEAVGDFAGAFENLLATGGRGKRALIELQNIALEAKEAGITTLDELHQYLVESGRFTTEEIEALFASFAQNGVGSLDDLLNANQDTLINLVATMDAKLQDAGKNWESLQELAEKYDNKLKEMQAAGYEITVEYHGIFTGDHPEGGITDPPKNEGDNTGPKMFNLSRMGRINMAGVPNLGLNSQSIRSERTAGGINLNIDARGAENGVEQAIVSTITNLEDQLYSRVMNSVYEIANKGGF